VKYREMTATDL